MANIKKLAENPELLSGGHRLCAGCGAGIVARQTMLAVGDRPVVVTNATGCLEVSTTIFPYTAWRVNWFHSAFENSAASCSGVEAAYRALKKLGRVQEDVRFIAFGGDGGTYDIGFQSLSGAMERRHRMLYICYNNEAYMNTGIQRSSATPRGATTTTAPTGAKVPGKMQQRKDLTACMVAHNLPYAAQAVVGEWNDFVTKVQKALDTDGPTFINILQPCMLGWGFPSSDTVSIGQQAVETCMWPLYEVENGVYKLTKRPKEKKPVAEWFKRQARFKHLFAPANAGLLADLQKDVDERWAKLLALCGEAPAQA
jgi:pyruvate ferredoxin oxidoreductase beta subunit